MRKWKLTSPDGRRVWTIEADRMTGFDTGTLWFHMEGNKDPKHAFSPVGWGTCEEITEEVPEEITATGERVVFKVIQLQDLLNGKSGTHLGIYEKAARELCRVMHWKWEGGDA